MEALERCGSSSPRSLACLKSLPENLSSASVFAGDPVSPGFHIVPVIFILNDVQNGQDGATRMIIYRWPQDKQAVWSDCPLLG